MSVYHSHKSTLSNESSKSILDALEAGNHELLDLTFSATKLANKDGMFGISDPQLTVYIKNSDADKNAWKEIGKTEQIRNNLDPVFQTPISVNYIFGVQQQLKMVMHDIDGNEKEKIGSATISVAELL